MTGLCLAFFVTPVCGDTIVLKSGRKIEVETAWTENNKVKAFLHGVQVSYALDQVEHIDRSAATAESGKNKRFTADIWSSGMDYDAIAHLAQEHAIRFRRLSKAADTADKPGTANEAEPVRAECLLYSEVLLGRPADIELVLSPGSLQLYRLNVRWQIAENQQRADFAGKVAGNLVRQYGQPSGKHARLLSSEFEWHHGQNSLITLKVESGLVQLSYVDRQLQHLAASEIRR